MKRLWAFLLAIIACVTFAACGPKEEGPKNYVLNEKTFFHVMKNMTYYPEQYADSTLELDCFTYELKDVDENSYMCGVRKCSAEIGCKCGNDTIIGFILEYDGEIPAPKNQSEDTNDKMWIHLKGKIKSPKMTSVTIRAYLPDGTPDPVKTEEVKFLVFVAETLDLIEDYSNLNYYVTK